MATVKLLEREEYIEQAYFFRVLRKRTIAGMATQEILEQVDQELLSTTHLPYAVQFLAAEVKHSGLLSSGFARLRHYFTPYQAYIIQGTEDENLRFGTEIALLVLEREAEFRAARVSPAGLFIYQFEVICRNRLGYSDGLAAMAADPFYPPEWSQFIQEATHQIGLIDLSDLFYLRSELALQDKLRQEPDYIAKHAVLFGEKEGKIAKANLGKEPLYLFAALQRQLGYPEVPRPVAPDSLPAKFERLLVKFHELETRMRVVESDIRGQLDMHELKELGKPEIFKDEPELFKKS